VKLLLNPSPLTVVANGSKILVYSSTLDAKKNFSAEAQLKKSIASIVQQLTPPASSSSKEMQIDMSVPDHPDTASFSPAYSTYDASQFDIGPLQSDKIRIAAKQPVSCGTWLALLRDLGQAMAGTSIEPPVTRIFFLPNAKDTSQAIQENGQPSSAPSPSSMPQSPSSSPPPLPTSAISNVGKNALASDATANGALPASSGASTPQTDAPPAVQTAASKAPGPSAASVKPFESDMLVFNGDSNAIRNEKRVLALLDLPRPEMIVNSWVLQESTSDPNGLGQFDEIVRRFVAQSNDELQQGINTGWKSVQASMAAGNYFDDPFYRYLVDRYIGEPSTVDEPIAASGESDLRVEKGICPSEEYCLGYTTIFSPLKPRLTDLLLAIIAAKNPVSVTNKAVEDMEGHPTTCDSKDCDKLRRQLSLCVGSDGKARCTGDSSSGGREIIKLSACGRRDLQKLVKSAGSDFLMGTPPQLQLECFRDTVSVLFIDGTSSPAQSLARAAVADFLFQYKMSQQYPDEFSPYNLTQSADALNTALTPLVDAFNRDVSAFQEYLNVVVQMAIESQRLKGSAFTNSGLVTVRTVSGSPADVSSTAQSFLDASNAPDIATLAANILNAQPGGGTTNLVAAAPGLLNNLSFNEAQVLMGALKSYQTTTAQIGRSIKIDVSPRSLSNASSAEMDVTLDASDAGTPSAYGGTGHQDLNISRVATHHTQTHIRVDSLKLFEVSSVAMKLSMTRPPFPIILPGVEMPYIGALVGYPRKPSTEYHSSVAIMSAIVVPTAADLAYGLAFVYDRVVYLPGTGCRRPWETGTLPYCAAMRAQSLSELDGPVIVFHRIRKQCIGTGEVHAYPTLEQRTQVSPDCQNLKFNTIMPEY
jgi:hypothetical protein